MANIRVYYINRTYDLDSYILRDVANPEALKFELRVLSKVSSVGSLLGFGPASNFKATDGYVGNLCTYLLDLAVELIQNPPRPEWHIWMYGLFRAGEDWYCTYSGKHLVDVEHFQFYSLEPDVAIPLEAPKKSKLRAAQFECDWETLSPTGELLKNKPLASDILKITADLCKGNLGA
jgi:hypothetical protein